MAKYLLISISICLLFSGCQSTSKDTSDGWISLFEGQTLDGWRPSENKDTFSVQDGMIVANGARSHLFYVGPVEDANFTNFEIKADIMTHERTNSGIFFHTEYQETGWPEKGYEVQINNTHSDWRKTGSLYDVNDVRESPVEDGVWFTEHIIVRGKRIIIKVNDQIIIDHTEPEGFVHGTFPGRKISSGTFALQGHDPGSLTYFRNIMVKPLP